MAKIIIVLVGIILVIILFISRDAEPVTQIPEEGVTEEEVPQENAFETYTDASLLLSFRYPSSYINEEPLLPSGTAHRLKTVMLVHESDRDMFENPPVGGEGPPAITMSVFHNANDELPRTWADTHIQESNINLAMSEIEEVSVGGAQAIRYRADGLYASEVAVITYGSYVYVVHGAFIDESSPTLRDYEPLLASITFVPEK